jgi:hypothetical protein
MKDKMRKLFSLSETDIEYFNDKMDKIELIDGSLDSRCIEHLIKVNKGFHESEKFRRDKDFHNSIKEPSCIKFAEFLRSTILNSLENIHWELEKMTSGIFRTKRYESSRLEAGEFLRECRKNEQTIVLLPKNKQENYCIERQLIVQVR